MAENALSVNGLSVKYGAIEAVKGIDLVVPKDSIVALLGANGAGKTSVLRAISGLSPVASGSITYFGKDITRFDTERTAKLGIAHSPEGRQIFGDLTVEENLQIGAYTIGDRRAVAENMRRCQRIFPRLAERMKQLAYTLSGGELQMLAIARALMMHPKLLLLDEPSLGLAPLIVRDIFDTLRQLRSEGITVLIVEQNALQTLKIADYGYVLELGTVRAQGSAADLLKDDTLVEAYLGGKA
ncbi:MAG: ABC transporter ATP-binding protein [Oscillospiraceae bacterium]|jgi:branched-chain amino acid transport system ATP-binding protein|nr:ABC transporter ATP-binding protein [Oscillospiraceae bacterium]